MSLSVDVAIAAATRVERTAGAASGIVVFRRLASGGSSGGELRGRAILGGIRCARSVKDPAALDFFVSLWGSVDVVPQAVWEHVFVECKVLARCGWLTQATALLYAETRRAVTVRGLYAYARCLDVAGDPKACAAFERALALGEKEGETSIVRASRVRLAAWLSRSAPTSDRALEALARVAAASATRHEKLVIAAVLLRAPSRFSRATAIGLLLEIVDVEDGLAAHARALGARHADDRGDALTALEADRLLALFSRERSQESAAVNQVRETIRVLARIAAAAQAHDEGACEAALFDGCRLYPQLAQLHQRAREIVQGRVEVWESRAPDEPLAYPDAYPEWTLLLDAAVALREAEPNRIVYALGRIAESVESSAPVPAATWALAERALGSDVAEVRAVAGRLVAALIRFSSLSPARGWLGIAESLTLCGMEELATTAWRAAALACEPHAKAALTLALARSGWTSALSGDRAAAIAKLREARDLAGRSAR